MRAQQDTDQVAVAHQVRRLGEFGIEPKTAMEFDARNVMAHVRTVVEADAATHLPESYEADGINVLLGVARFMDPHTITVGDRIVTSKEFVICTGSHPFVPPIEGLQDIPYLTNETIFSLETLPRSMVVLGAGPIGAEMAAALNRLDVDVAVLQRSSSFLKKDDRELTDRLMQILRDEGVRILLETQMRRFARQGDAIVVDIENKEGAATLAADSVLVALGRVPNVAGLDLENAGVAYDSHGLKVDKHLRTTAPNIYGAGDVVPPYLFTHIAEYEAIGATTNACFGLPLRTADYDHVLWATYTDPELAHAGLTEEEARARYGDSIRIYRWENRNVDRAKTDLADKGLSKFICDRKGRLLGIHILGHGAAELMHEAQLAKSLGIPFGKIASVIHAHPSYSDAVRQPAKRCHIDTLQNNFFLRLLKKIAPRKGE